MRALTHDRLVLPLPPVRRGGRFGFGRARDEVRLWCTLARERRQLAALSPAERRDLGLDAADVAREAARPFWDVPPNRR